MKYSLLDFVSNRINSENLYEERTSLGLNKKIQKKFDDVDAIDEISEYVDLGLPSGTLWCKHNYGADEEYGYGDLFNHEEAMNLDLSPGHLPSKEYFKELYDNCTHTWTHVHGIDGQLFTSKINGKKVFFPASGYRRALTIFGRGFGGNYWSSSIYAFSRSCYAMNFNSSFIKPIDHSFISFNYSVRAVISKTNESINLGLNSKVKKKFDNVDAVGNVSQIHFEDPEVERICHEHGVYTYVDASKVTSIKSWFIKRENIKTFNELKFFTGLKIIEDEAFWLCTALQSITIPNSVTSIWNWAFRYCESLQSVTIPNSVTSIGEKAFAWCGSFQSVSIPNSVTSIRDYAFAWCESLQSINIPDSVISIGNLAFRGCESLKTISISKNCPVYEQIRKACPDIQLIEPKVNESSNLGLNSKVKKKFETYVKDKDQISEISEDTLIDLYDIWGHVPIEWQDQHFTHTLSPSDEKAIKTITSSYSKFIHDMTDGDYVFRYNDHWGQENLDAIEFWKDESSPGVKIRKTFKNKLYGECLYWDEMKRRFYKGNENFIRDWFIPATVKLIDKHPEMKPYFFKKMRR